MIAVITIVYIALVLLIYKILKVKPSPKNVAVMVVLGVFLIGAVVIKWKFSAPTSNQLVVSRYTVQLVPQVRGPITKIHAEPNVPLKKGEDLLFEIQSDTYQNTYDQISESLDAANKSVEQLNAAIEAARAGVARAVAAQQAAETELTISEKSEERLAGSVSKLQLQQLRQQLNAADASVDQANATLLQSQLGMQAAESTARSLEAQLANAKFNLDQCRVYAPSDGFVTNWMVREGTMAVPMPFSPLGTFVDSTQLILVASFPQNLLCNVQPGDRAELTFKSRPGEVFTGAVEDIVQATGEGQFAVTGSLPSAASLGSSGKFAAKFVMDDTEAAQLLAVGTSGNVVIYTDHGKAFHVISKVVIRMNAWLYYLLPF
ncbi:HlyD family secretion protein [Rhodopirellula europaea]|jgi:multidrug resistance efflux pump|uniref:Protein secretion protein, HlyD family n=1 Tax=Rhodopirellula europaea SH398 TaxID=1263868 RepID=M5S5A6_9BACT|nr:efflux RND transporter periplasmic adaptor subunit [Rhodopirellula europaea]EMI26798.1 protein secretion protein, HlyD family [Rhodopirellula europaea SH398]